MQLHFEFRQSVLREVRRRAAAEDLSYADYVRKAVGLPHAKIQRPRISLSFSKDDLEALAERYGRHAGTKRPETLRDGRNQRPPRRLGMTTRP